MTLSSTAVVVTSIHPPRDEFLRWLDISGVMMIVVADKKTNELSWRILEENHPNLKFLSTEEQERNFSKLSELIGWNTYSRKNLGYLVALQMGFKRIFETDDDTFPRSLIGEFFNRSHGSSFPTKEITGSDSINWWNPYAFYAPNEFIWPRGWPLTMLSGNSAQIDYKELHLEISTQQTAHFQFLVNGDPDVDAIFRLVHGSRQYNFGESVDLVYLPPNFISVGNTQATLYVGLGDLLYTPTTCSPRVCDIVKSWIVQSRTRTFFGGFLVHQDRNEHSLLDDFELEIPLYLNSKGIAEAIWQSSNLTIEETYQILIEKRVLETRELSVFKEFRNCIPR